MVGSRASVDDLFYRPRHPYSVGLMRAVPRVSGALGSVASIPGSPPDLIRLPRGCTYYPRCPFHIDDCLVADPPLVPVDTPHHEAACIRWGAVAEKLGLTAEEYRTIESGTSEIEEWGPNQYGDIMYSVVAFAGAEMIKRNFKDRDKALELQGLLKESIDEMRVFNVESAGTSKNGNPKWKLVGLAKTSQNGRAEQNGHGTASPPLWLAVKSAALSAADTRSPKWQ